MQGNAGTPTQADLTNDAALVRLLLDDTRLWRQRLVETLQFGASDTVRVRSQYQIELTSGLLLHHGLIEPGTQSVRAILPLTTRPKASLLSLDLGGPDGAPARLLLRRDIAAFEAAYLRELWEAGPTPLDPPNDGLLEAITGFHAGRYGLSRREEVSEDDAISRFLSETLRFHVPPQWVRAHRENSRLSELLSRALEAAPNPLSAAENPLLALAALVPRPSTLEAAEILIQDYTDKVVAAATAGDVEFLEALADYGTHWEVLIETELPLDQPVIIRLAEDRHIDLSRGTTQVHLAMGDAASYHLEARLEDHAVEFASARYASLQGSPLSLNSIEDRRDLPHSLALYSSRPLRPYYAHLHVRLRLAKDQRLASILVCLLLIGALAIATFIPFGSQAIEAMALLTVPTTFAATLVLTRPESPLAARLGISVRWTLVILVLLLWAIAILRVAEAAPDTRSTDSAAQGIQLSAQGGNHG